MVNFFWAKEAYRMCGDRSVLAGCCSVWLYSMMMRFVSRC